MKPSLALRLLITVLALASLSVRAAESNALSYADLMKALDARLQYKTGTVTLPGGMATLNLPPSFRYLSPDDADFVLTKLWGNPPGPKTLGMIFPTDLSPASSNAWGVVITFSDDGYIKDADADSIDYQKLLTKMQKAVADANAARSKAGFGEVQLVGWAKPPHYDKQAHKMYWAKELKFSEAPINTLNYNIRVLGRRGVLNLNAVSSMTALADIEASAPEIVGLVNFTDGNRYADFNKSTDKVAAYGLAALVAGGIAAKAGLFKVLLAGLVAAKKLVIIAVIAVAAFLKKIFSREKNPPAAT
jgi:uncharacterized membrane-anchored protein